MATTTDDDPLGQVALRVSELPARLCQLDLPKGPDGLVGLLRVVARAPGTVLRTLQQARGLPDEEETHRLYRRATGADLDRGRADVAAVVERLVPLSSASEDLVREAAGWLVRWVAAGRPDHGPRHDLVEARFAALIERRGDGGDDHLLEGYEQAWIAHLAAQRQGP